MKPKFGAWAITIDAPCKLRLARFWRQRLSSLAAVRTEPSSRNVSSVCLIVLAVLAFGMPTLLTASRSGNGAHDPAASESEGAQSAASAAARERRERDEPAELVESRRRLTRIGLAMWNYRDAIGPGSRFPAAASMPPGGLNALSWRVKLLPFLGHAELYQAYRQNEPWDSEHNLKLVEQMPNVYLVPTGTAMPIGHTSYLAPVGKTTWFPADEAQRQVEFVTQPDGRLEFKGKLGSTILIVEADAKHAVPWTKPEDLKFNPDQPLNGLIGHRQWSFVALFVDGSTAAIPELLRTKDGQALGPKRSREVIRDLFNPDDKRIPELDIDKRAILE